MNQRKKGFTLMEMLIVVAIISVLVAVSIPVFTSQLNKTKESVCAANRRSAKGVMAVVAMTDGEALKDFKKDGTYEWTEVKEALKKSGHPFEDKICPSIDDSGIKVKIEGGGYTLICEYHKGEDVRTNWITGEQKGGDYLSKVQEQFKDKYGSPEDKNYVASNDDYRFMKMYNSYLKENGYQTTTPKELVDKGYLPTEPESKDGKLYWTATRVYFDGESHDIMFLTTKEKVQTVMESVGNPSLTGYLFTYDGKYYVSSNNTVDKVSMSGFYGGSGTIKWPLDKFLAEKGWVEVP